jgi:glycosyltransferase involved in cell wall biosynthesis
VSPVRTRGKPKQCMHAHAFFPLEVRIAAEVRAAVDAGFEVDVVCLRGEGEPAVDVCEGATVYRLPISHVHGAGPIRVVGEYLGFTILAALKAARLAIRRRYDVVQVHNPPDFLVAAALVPRALGSRIVLDIHDLSPDMYNMRFEGRRGAGGADRILRMIERAAVSFADEVLTVHEPYRQELIGRGAPAAKVSVVLNTLDERLVPGTERREALGRFVVSYHGTVTPHYGVELLVGAAAAALEEIPELAIEIYGRGDSVPDVRSRAEELGIGGRVHVHDEWRPQRDVLAIVQNAAVGVVPNLPTRLNRFALSTKLFEYVALGVPVVCSDLATLRTYFSEDEVLFFRPGDERSLAAALVEVAQSPDAARARAVAAHARYQSYRWPVNAERYVKVVKKAARR